MPAALNWLHGADLLSAAGVPPKPRGVLRIGERSPRWKLVRMSISFHLGAWGIRRLRRRGGVSRSGVDVQDVGSQGVGYEAGQPPGHRAPIEARTPCDLLGLGSRDIGDEATGIGT